MPISSPCPVARSTALLGDHWSLLLIRDAFDGVRRFSDFQRSVGAARNILSNRLKRLVEAGILLQQPASDGSAYQEYVLTDAGQELFPLLVALRQWGERHCFAADEAHSTLIERATGRPLPYMQPHGSNGKPLEASKSRVQKLDNGLH